MKRIKIFGKENCGKCLATKDKFNFFVKKWGCQNTKIIYYSLDALDGLAEAAYHNALENPPTTIIEEDGKVLARFEGKVPKSQEFKSYLSIQP